MENQDKAWREIQLLIERDKAAALDEFRRLPFRPEAPARPPAWFRLHPALAAVAASLLLAVALLSFWLLRANWESAPTTPTWSGILSDSFLYAKAGSGESARSVDGAMGPMSPYFAAWADTLERSATVSGESPRTFPEQMVVERGDPEEVSRKISRAIQEDVFERLLSDLHEFHEKEA
jgi:hypothetical protein